MTILLDIFCLFYSHSLKIDSKGHAESSETEEAACSSVSLGFSSLLLVETGQKHEQCALGE